MAEGEECWALIGLGEEKLSGSRAAVWRCQQNLPVSVPLPVSFSSLHLDIFLHHSKLQVPVNSSFQSRPVSNFVRRLFSILSTFGRAIRPL
jgi:hypothetical protein